MVEVVDPEQSGGDPPLYLVRVPPSVATAREAVAWVADMHRHGHAYEPE